MLCKHLLKALHRRGLTFRINPTPCWIALTYPYVRNCCSVTQLCPTLLSPWTAARQDSLSFTISQSLLKFMSIGLVMPSNHLMLCYPLLLLPSVFPSELALHLRWPKYWSFSFSIHPSNEYSGFWFPLGLIRANAILFCFPIRAAPRMGTVLLWHRVAATLLLQARHLSALAHHLSTEPRSGLRVFHNTALATHDKPMSIGISVTPVCHPCPRVYEAGGSLRVEDSLHDSRQGI